MERHESLHFDVERTDDESIQRWEEEDVSAVRNLPNDPSTKRKNLSVAIEDSTTISEEDTSEFERDFKKSLPKFAALMQSQRQQFEFQKKELIESVQQEMMKQASFNSMYTLHKDTYSLLLTCDYRTIMFLAAIFTWGIAIALYTLAIISITDFDSNPDNPLNIPAGVQVSVTLAQFLCVGTAVLVQDSLRECIFVAENFIKLMESVPNVTKTRIYICFVTKLAETLLSLLFILILICQSEDVVELLKDFTALLFISSLDNVVFKVGEEGYLGGRFKESAAETQAYRFKPSGGSRRKTIIRFLVMTTVYVSMLGSWLILCPIRQNNGHYLVDRVAVQFPDSSDESLQSFTGIYERSGSHDRRVRYLETNPAIRDTTTPASGRRAQTATPRHPAYFAYCDSKRAWVFVTRSGGNSPCSDYTAFSDEYTGYDLTEVQSLTWYLNDGTDKREPLQNFFFREYYSSDIDFENQLRFGLFGEFDLPCKELHLDELKGRFVTTREFASRYSLLLDDSGSIVKVYARPVYVNNSTLDLIIFTGSAWILTGASFLHDYDPTSDLATYLTNSFHAHWSNYDTFLITRTVVFSSENDGATPIGLNWHPFNPQTRAADETQTVDAALLCAICESEKNPCYYEGECQDDGSCSCHTGSSGVLCQVPPTSNGLCNPFFNNPAFSWDGGDCCKATCRSTELFACGLDETRRFPRDFLLCEDPDVSYHCNDASSDCWKVGGDTIYGEGNNAEAGFSLFGSNGVLVIGEPGANSVRVFDRYGAEFVYRDSLPSTGGAARFGSSVSVAASKHVFGSPERPSRPVIAASGVGKFLVFQWTDQNEWEDVSPQVFNPYDAADPGLLTVGLFQEGKTVAVFEYSTGNHFGRATVWKRQDRESAWKLASSNITCECSDFSLSEDGTHLLAAHSAKEMAFLYVFDELAHDFEEVGVVELGFVPRSIGLSESGNVFGVLGIRDGDDYKKELCMFHRTTEAYLYAKQPACTRNVEISATTKDSIDLNADGSIIAIAMKEANKIRTFRYNNGTWHEFEQDLDGFSASMVDDTELIVGQPLDDTVGSNRGKVSIFARRAPGCEATEAVVEVSILLDDHPEQTWWQLYDHAERTVVAQREPYQLLDANLAVHHDLCVPREHCLTLVVYSVHGNGVSSMYSVAVDGETVSVNLSDQGLVAFVDLGPGDGCAASPQLPLLQKPLFNHCWNVTCDWNQFADDLHGSADNERFGTRVSISHDGGLLAVSSVQRPNTVENSEESGHVRTFVSTGSEQDGSSVWAHLGGMHGPRTFGEAMALASGEDVIVVGAPTVTDRFGLPAQGSGYVEVYELKNGNWEQKGSTLELSGQDHGFGSVAAISGDGSVIAVGSHSGQHSFDYSGGFSHVYVFVFDEGMNDWSEQGNVSFWYLPEGTGNHGYSLALSANGAVLALSGQVDEAGVVKMLDCKTLNMLGNEIPYGHGAQMGNSKQGTSDEWRYGDAMSLSKDGTILAIGTLDELYSGESFVDVWRYDDTINVWVQLGQRISPEENGSEAGILALSADGHMIAVGSPAFGAGTGLVRVFYYADPINAWFQIGTDINGKEPQGFFGNSLSLDGYGMRLAAAGFSSSAPGVTFAGRVQVFDAAASKALVSDPGAAGCGTGELLIRMAMTLDQYPEDISYTIRDSKSNELAALSFAGAAPGDHKTELHCVPKGDSLRFDMADKFGDGLCCDNGKGSFQLSRNGESILEGSDFGSSVSFCLSPDHAFLDATFNHNFHFQSLISSRLEHFSSNGSVVELASFNFAADADRTAWAVNTCVPRGCLAFTIDESTRFWLSLAYNQQTQIETEATQSTSGLFRVFWFGDCHNLCPSGNRVEVSLEPHGAFSHDQQYSEHYSLVDESMGHVLWDLQFNASEKAADRTMNYWACAPIDSCLTFSLDLDVSDDTVRPEFWGGGYSSWLNEETQVEVRSYPVTGMIYPKLHQFGACELVCKEGDALLYIRATTGRIVYQPSNLIHSVAYSVWSLFGSSSEALMSHGYTNDESYKVFEYNFCLPVNEPHYFHFSGDAAEYELSWDGNAIGLNHSFVRFGQIPECADGEFLASVLVESDGYRPDEMWWALQDSNGTTTFSMNGYGPDQRRQFFHHSACVSDPCGNFSWRGDPGWMAEKLQVLVGEFEVAAVREKKRGGNKELFEFSFCRPSCACDETGKNCGDFDGFLAGAGEIGCLPDCSNVSTTKCHRIVLEETNLSAELGSLSAFTGNVTISHNISYIKFEIYGGSGDADLYVKYGSPVNPIEYDCGSTLPGNNEQCSSSNGAPRAIGAQQGVYYYMLLAYEVFSGVTLRVTVDGVQI